MKKKTINRTQFIVSLILSNPRLSNWTSIFERRLRRVEAKRNFKCLRWALQLLLLVSCDLSLKFGKALSNAAHSFGHSIKRVLLTTANLCSTRYPRTDYRVACSFCAQFEHESRLSIVYLLCNLRLFIQL